MNDNDIDSAAVINLNSDCSSDDEESEEESSIQHLHRAANGLANGHRMLLTEISTGREEKISFERIQGRKEACIVLYSNERESFLIFVDEIVASQISMAVEWSISLNVVKEDVRKFGTL